MNSTLQSGTTILGGKYRIEKVLGKGGFGITYLATQVNLNRRVAIKEFFLSSYCSRAKGRQEVRTSIARNDAMVRKYCGKFIREAQMIAEMEHPNIVPVYDVFEDNGTAYYVMKYIEGSSLDEILAENGSLEEDVAVDYISQIAGALDYVHSNNTLHLDIKPSNILISGEKAILIDFGVSKHYDSRGTQTSSTPVGFSVGYAPLEQCRGDICTFTPATDIYSLSATFYKMLIGVVPPSAGEIYETGLQEIDSKFSPGVRDAIRAGMSVSKNARPQNISAFLGILHNEPFVDNVEYDEVVEYDVVVEDEPMHNAAVIPSTTKRGPYRPVLIAILVLVIAIASFLLFINIF